MLAYSTTNVSEDGPILSNPERTRAILPADVTLSGLKGATLRRHSKLEPFSIIRNHLTDFSRLLARHALRGGLVDHKRSITTPSGREKPAFVVSKTRFQHEGGSMAEEQNAP